MENIIVKNLPPEINQIFGKIKFTFDNPKSDRFAIIEFEGLILGNDLFNENRLTGEEYTIIEITENCMDKLKKFPKLLKKIQKAKAKGLNAYLYGNIKE